MTILMVTDLPLGFGTTSRLSRRSILLFLRQKYIGIFFIILSALLRSAASLLLLFCFLNLCKFNLRITVKVNSPYDCHWFGAHEFEFLFDRRI